MDGGKLKITNKPQIYPCPILRSIKQSSILFSVSPATTVLTYSHFLRRLSGVLDLFPPVSHLLLLHLIRLGKADALIVPVTAVPVIIKTGIIASQAYQIARVRKVNRTIVSK